MRSFLFLRCTNSGRVVLLQSHPDGSDSSYSAYIRWLWLERPAACCLRCHVLPGIAEITRYTPDVYIHMSCLTRRTAAVCHLIHVAVALFFTALDQGSLPLVACSAHFIDTLEDIMTTFNFCAGPAMLPVDVMAKAQEEFVNWHGRGCSIMEMSHRGKDFMAVAAKAEQDLRDLLQIPSNYKVLFMHGGGRGQFSAVPLNLLGAKNDAADYIISGSWSLAAADEADKYGQIQRQSIVQRSEGMRSLLPASQWQINSASRFVHFCPNETVDGLEFTDLPTTEVPLVADLSSTILSRPIDVARYGVIYAGAQKNIGPSGLTLVIVRDDLLPAKDAKIPAILDYRLAADNDSMFNTPPTYAWYLAGLVFEWLKAQGGLAAMAQRNAEKAHTLYQFLDQSSFYRNDVVDTNRSWMNVPFFLADERLNDTFLQQAEQHGLLALKGHRIVGGMRASLYNAMPLEGVQTLVAFMREFERVHG